MPMPVIQGEPIMTLGQLNEDEMKIAVAGTGYVGLSMATLLAQHHSVVAVDVVAEKVEKINRRESPIQDEYPPSRSSPRERKCY